MCRLENGALSDPCKARAICVSFCGDSCRPGRLRWLLLANALSAERADTVDGSIRDRGRPHYRQQHWQEACYELDRLLAAHPDHRRANQARFFYGEALSQLERWTQAQAQFAELIRRDAGHRYARQALFRSGETAYLGGELAVAERDLAAFRARYPQDELNGYALPYLASLALRAEHAVVAETLFIAALEQFPAGPLVDDCHLGLRAGPTAQAEGTARRCRRKRANTKIVAEGQLAAGRSGFAASCGTLENAFAASMKRGVAATLERLAAKNVAHTSPCSVA